MEINFSKKKINILISQSFSRGSDLPYLELSKQNNIKINFRSFIEIVEVSPNEIRKQKINFSDFTVIFFISKTSIDHYFKFAKYMRFKVPISMKYICHNNAIACYLQKYIVYRKRKIYIGNKYFKDVIPHIKKNSNEKFLLPSSDTLTSEIPNILDKLDISWKRAILYKTISSDLSDLKNMYYDYDILVFFTPAEIKSLFENFPNFVQNNIKIATFGKNTFDAASKYRLKIDIKVPTPECQSMLMALKQYIKKYMKQNNKLFNSNRFS